MSDTCVEMIEIDDLPSSQGNTSNNIIVLDETHSISSTDDSQLSEISHKTKENNCDENKLISKIIKICLKLENSDGMSRVLNKCMLSLYKQADIKYKNSEELKEVLKNTIKKLKTDPDHKFSHVKNLCDKLKLHKLKKRANLVTLSTCLDKNTGVLDVNKLRKRQKIDTIELDDGQDIIDLDSDDEILLNQNNNCDKENNLQMNLDNEKLNDIIEPLSNREFSNKVNLITSESASEIVHRLDNKINEVENSFLVPVGSSHVISHVIDETKVKEIEEEIAYCKRQISLLDEEEVCNDSTSSPYIRSEKYKTKIVELYKQLCQLTGDEPVKRREVRLQVLPGHPPGPVKYLEEFLNDNIGENGEPPFPDFHDVVSCVTAANHHDDLGWNSVRILNEANALFTQCGRALQKRRQQRDWRFMLSRVNLKDVQDPADEDPELMARLEANKRLARQKEEDVIEMYTNMDHKTKDNNAQMKLIITNEKDSSDDDSDSESERQTCDGVEPTELKPTDEDSKSANSSSVTKDEDAEDNNSKVKTEPVDISAILNELGNDFSNTIIEVEDPFMVIEISSDSEDED